MRRWSAAPVVFLALIGLASVSAPPAAAQPPAPEEESFLTADGVQLKGVFHATDKTPAAAPVVVLMYSPGPDRDMTKGDWAGLAKILNDKGYHVFRFDWRGHGKSLEIKDAKKFWENPFLNVGGANLNAYIKGGGATKKPLKDKFTIKEVSQPNKFIPAYLNDLAAVRVHLDTKNDNKALNTSSIYLIGAGDAATIGMAWLTAEWQRPAVFPTGKLGMNGTIPVADYTYVPQQIFGQIPAEGGQDISGAVWLTATRPTTISENTTKKWVADLAPKIRENNPMLFLYAEKDKDVGKVQSEFFFKEVLIGDPVKAKARGLSPLSQTFLKEVKGAELSGVKLLGNGAPKKTEDLIVEFLGEIQKERAKVASKTRNYNNPYFVNLASFSLVAP